MSKKDEQVVNDTTQQPSVYDELLKNGTAILEAQTREALSEMVNNIPAECKYCVGGVGRKQDGSAYTLQVDIVKQ